VFPLINECEKKKGELSTPLKRAETVPFGQDDGRGAASWRREKNSPRP